MTSALPHRILMRLSPSLAQVKLERAHRMVAETSKFFVGRKNAFAFGGTALATAAAVIVGELLLPLNVDQQRGPMSLLLLLIVVSASVLHGSGLGLFATTLSSLTLDFFFIAPKYSFAIADPVEAFAFLTFAMASIAVAQLAGRLKAREAAQKEQLRIGGYLLRVSTRLGPTASIEDICAVSAEEGQHLYGKRTAMVLARTADGEIVIRPSANNLTPTERQMLQDRLALPLASIEPPTGWVLFPLSPGKAPIGFIVVSAHALATQPEQAALLHALALHVSLVMEARILQASLGRERSATENERFRSTFLHAIAHDLRTPLAVIRGNIELLTDAFVRSDPRSAALGRIRGAIESAVTFIDGVQALVREGKEAAVAAPLLAGRVENELKRILDLMTPYVVANPIHLRAERQVPECLLSPTFFEHIMVNLIENASRASPPGAPIWIRVYGEATHVVVEVQDEGTGFDEPNIDLIFERYQKGALSPGSGLGLTIAREFARRMRARIEAHNRSDRSGARIALHLEPAPLASPAEVVTPLQQPL